MISLFRVQPPQERGDLRSRAVVGGAEQPTADAAGDAVLLGPRHSACIVSVRRYVTEPGAAAHGGAASRTVQERRTLSAGAVQVGTEGGLRRALGDRALGTVGKATFDTACRKSLFATLCKFSELHKSSENLGFQWRRETGEAPPVADEASLFRGRLPNSGYKVSAVWLEPTVYPFLGFPRTPFLTVAENLPLYRQSR